jgi:hypothetical protein
MGHRFIPQTLLEDGLAYFKIARANWLLQPVFVPFAALFTVGLFRRFISKENAILPTETFAHELWTSVTGRFWRLTAFLTHQESQPLPHILFYTTSIYTAHT